jgi:hypothetical protein
MTGCSGIILAYGAGSPSLLFTILNNIDGTQRLGGDVTPRHDPAVDLGCAEYLLVVLLQSFPIEMFGAKQIPSDVIAPSHSTTEIKSMQILLFKLSI